MIRISNKLLYDKTEEVTDFKDCFQKAIKVKGWLKNKKAYAIAFNQLGLKERCFVIRKPKKLKLEYDIIMNPTLLPFESKEILFEETCLSFPGRTFQMRRKEQIKVNFYDYSNKEWVNLRLDGIAAIVFQHEIAHLDGLPDDVTCMQNQGDTLSGHQ